MALADSIADSSSFVVNEPLPNETDMRDLSLMCVCVTTDDSMTTGAFCLLGL